MFKKTFFFVLLSSVLWLAGCGGTKSELSTPNLALKKNAVASSFEKANQYNGNMDTVAALVVDGDRKTRWSSDFQGTPDPNSAWIYVDLGQKTEIKAVRVYWEAAFAKAFDIEVSDDAKTWTVAAEVKGNFKPTTVNNFDKPVSAQYVRLNLKSRATQYGYSIYEIEVY